MTTRKLGKKTGHRGRSIRNLATSIVLYEKIRTTDAKAHALVPVIERLIASSRSGSIDARRRAKAVLFDANAVTKLFEDFPQRLGDRTSGYTRLTKLAPRPGDGSEMTQVEIILTPLEAIIEAETKTKVSVRKTKKTEEEPV
jgi:large subunit ribosomal protein L17